MDEVVWIEIFRCYCKYCNCIWWGETICYNSIRGENYFVESNRKWIDKVDFYY